MSEKSTVSAHILTLRSSLESSSTLPFTSGIHLVRDEDLGLFYKAGDESNEARYIDFNQATDEQLEQLAKACERASFGLNQENVLDENYRKAGKMDLDKFAARFDVSGVLGVVAPYLFEDQGTGASTLHAEMYKLNVYGPGSFFKAHQDTPRSSDMVGSLVVVLPTKHTGGALTLAHDAHTGTFNSSTLLGLHASSAAAPAPAIAYCAFFSDVVHAVEPVVSGYRVTLTYNLYHAQRPRVVGDGERLVPAPEQAFETALRALIADGTFMPEGGLLAFGLSHQYPIPQPPPQPAKHDPDNDPDDYRGRMPEWTADKPDSARTGAGTHAELVRILKGNDARIRSAASRVGLASFVNLAYDARNLSIYWRTQVITGKAMDLTSLDEEDSWGFDQEMFKRGQVVVPQKVDSNGNVSKVWEEVEDTEDVIWVTKRKLMNKVETHYMAYGNEASVGHMYGDAALFVRIPAVGEKGREALEGSDD
ncbi:Fe2OG dioxygenase domain-containing protein [Mycena kentingensis (nom. inval.)]|nr:Fe2OG dioxygenase domain-containing protein [Mycena kentingensis (nom. inval.)]